MRRGCGSQNFYFHAHFQDHPRLSKDDIVDDTGFFTYIVHACTGTGASIWIQVLRYNNMDSGVPRNIRQLCRIIKWEVLLVLPVK